jgi:hypothetical protein
MIQTYVQADSVELNDDGTVSCSSRTAVCKNLYSAAVSVGIFGGTGSKMPSMREWGSCATYLGKQS